MTGRMVSGNVEMSAVHVLVNALLQWKCGACGGSGKYHQNRSVTERKLEQGQELDAHFNPEPVTCKVCGGGGLNPIAGAALDEVSNG